MKIKLEDEEREVIEVRGLNKIKGLMFSKKKNLIFDLNYKKGLVHSFFVFFPIKLYFLDSDFGVLEKKELRPFRIYLPKVKAKWLVEISLF